LISLISFIFVIAVCVIVHEFGHYKTAKMLGVQSHEFSIGMGTLIYQKKDSQGMLWSIRALPIGGFVRIAGMGEEKDENEESVKPGMGFNDKPSWIRFLILANGSIMNIVLAIILTAVFLYGHGTVDMQSTRIGTIMPDYPAEIMRLQPNDRIVEINGETVNDWRSMTEMIRSSGVKGIVNLRIERESRTFNIDVMIPIDQKSKVPMLGITPSIKTYTLIGSATNALSHILYVTNELFKGLYKLITVSEETVDIAGPVGIAVISGQAARAGFWSFITFLALISLNLGILNLFPFPALDGGHLLILLGEMIFRRRLPIRIKHYIHLAGFAFLMTLILVVTWNDIVKLLEK